MAIAASEHRTAHRLGAGVRWLAVVGIRKADTILLALAALTPQLFLGDSVYADSSAGLQFNPLDLWSRLNYVWDGRLFLGYNQGWGQTYLFPAGLFFASGTLLGIPMWLLQRMWLFGILFLAGYGAKCLARRAWPQRSGVAAGLTSGLVYMLSPFNFLYLTNGSAVLLPYACLPLILYLAMGLVRNGFSVGRFLLLVGVSCLQSFIQPAFVAVNFLVVVGYLLFDSVLPRLSWQRIRYNSALLLAYILSVVLLSLWWLLPAIAFVTSHGTSQYTRTENPLTLNISSSYLEVLRMLGNSGFYGSYANGTPYIAYAPLYTSNAIWISTSFLIPAMAFAGFLTASRGSMWRNTRTDDLLFFAVLVLVGVPLASGAYPPANPSPSGMLYLFLFNHVPGFEIFKQSNVFVTTIALGYCYLVGAFVMWLWGVSPSSRHTTITKERGLKTRIHPGQLARTIAVASVAAVILINGWPIASASVVPSTSRFLSVPHYWYDAASWINRQPGDFRIFLTPYQYFPRYTWSQMPAPVEPSLIRASIVEPIAGVAAYGPDGQTFTSSLYEALNRNRTAALPALLSVLNAEFVLQRNDVTWQLDESPSPRLMQDRLNASMTYEQTFGQLNLYRNPAWSPAFLFAPETMTWFDGKPQSLLTAIGGGQLVQFSVSRPSSSADVLYYGHSMMNFSVSTNASLLSGNALGLVWISGSTQVSAYLGAFGSGFNVTGAQGGQASGFTASLGRSYFLQLTKQSNRFTMYADGVQLASILLENATEGGVGVASLESVAEFNDITITDLDGASRIERLDFNDVPYGPFNSADWTSLGGDWEVSTSSRGGNVSRGFPTNAFVSCSEFLNATSLASCLASGSNVTVDLSPPSVSYYEVNPVDYRIHIGRSATPFMLAMSQSYDPDWQLSSEGATFRSFHVDSYAMGWWIPPQNGTYLELRYRGQSGFVLGSLLSLAGTLTMVALPPIVQLHKRGRRRRGFPRLAVSTQTLAPGQQGDSQPPASQERGG